MIGPAVQPLIASRLAEAARDIAAGLGPVASAAPVFAAPWQARVFSLVVALIESGRIDRNEFRARLIAEIGQADKQGETGAYYHCWLAAAEGLFATRGWLRPGELQAAIDHLASDAHPADHRHGHDIDTQER